MTDTFKESDEPILVYDIDQDKMRPITKVDVIVAGISVNAYWHLMSFVNAYENGEMSWKELMLGRDDLEAKRRKSIEEAKANG